MRSRRSIALALFGVLATLVPLAWASPVDPTWFAGLYDNGDSDEAVLRALATSESAAAVMRVVIDIAKQDTYVAVLAAGLGGAAGTAAPPDLTRAPPHRSP